ncbi:nucleotide sugar dehydrogenase [Paucisalibacillus globulus]|uniref:nucleotide sugar dehydrogenase n=1 Tax=Paucisalibacillus globulus TaxID=351095 RepID=UPI0004072C54|nr:nucleotide sugar dehydrogenase [Paucisalibacillus globulus]
MKTRIARTYEEMDGISKKDLPIIGVVGLGYVGLPVALAFSQKYTVIGYDVNQDRVYSLQNHIDETREVPSEALVESSIDFTINEEQLSSCDVIIVTVPTPLNTCKDPDLSFLTNASTTIGKYMKSGTIVIYESTVYPGATEEVCIPILEKSSNLKCGQEFFIGYSPERINPGDRTHTFSNTAKIVAAQDNVTLEKIYLLYQNVIDAEVYQASSIKVAEATKLVENTQRDINIAYMNELSLIFRQMGINTQEVLDAAKTKWNFIPFNPGLVGGHCIGVDPYYFIYQSALKGYKPKFLELARQINESMTDVVTDIALEHVKEQQLKPSQIKVGVLGLTFKENVPDIRNSKSMEVAFKLAEYGFDVYTHDPYLNQKVIPEQDNLKHVEWDQLKDLDIVILAVPHQEYRSKKEVDFQKLLRKEEGMIIDIKGLVWKHKFSKNIQVINL